jgi:hypothetical protein
VRVLSLLFLVVSACQVPTEILYGRTYFCDGTAQADTCGNTQDGAPMTCYMARQIGARDICTERCLEGDARASGPGWRCVDTKARLSTCRPSEGDHACSQPATNCLRTDGLKDEGVCMSMDTCTQDTDCRDPGRPTCMSALVQQFYGTGAGIAVDHSSCLRARCRKEGAGCAPGEACLPNVIPAASNPPDICVPICDTALNCPPNYFCLQKVSGPAFPKVCIPGILGFRCITDMDCLIGDCVDTGDGFNLCSTPCNSDQDCDRFGVARGALFCATDPRGGGKRCLNAEAFAGNNCFSDSHCRAHESCIHLSPYFGLPMQAGVGECRARCAPDLPCVDRAGVPHVCVELEGKQTCYPGRFHLPCADDSDCVGRLKCLEVTAGDETGHLVRRRRCSAPCQTDGDCNANPFTGTSTFCNEAACAARGHQGVPCRADRECLQELMCRPSANKEEAAMGVQRCAERQ